MTRITGIVAAARSVVAVIMAAISGASPPSCLDKIYAVLAEGNDANNRAIFAYKPSTFIISQTRAVTKGIANSLKMAVHAREFLDV